MRDVAIFWVGIEPLAELLAPLELPSLIANPKRSKCLSALPLANTNTNEPQATAQRCASASQALIVAVQEHQS